MAVFRNFDGLTFGLRPVDLDDAESIVSIRHGDPSRSRFLNPIPSDPQIQRDYIQRQRLKESDYYFRICDLEGERTEGFIGLYAVSSGSGEWGRWVIDPGSMAALESVCLILHFGFQSLDLDKIYCNTIAQNASTLSFHDSFGFRRAGDCIVGTDPEKLRTAITHEITKDEWHQIEPRHRRVLQRLAARRRK
jgi:RimJ/RimL family protein N-acetyltransferase